MLYYIAKTPGDLRKGGEPQEVFELTCETRQA